MSKGVLNNAKVTRVKGEKLMNSLQKDYLNYRKSEYPKQNKGYTLHSMSTKNFGMANSVSTIFYGGYLNE